MTENLKKNIDLLENKSCYDLASSLCKCNQNDETLSIMYEGWNSGI